MIEGTINGRPFQLPESFDEFSSRHWKIFMRVMTDYRVSVWHDVRIAFVMKLVKLPKFRLLQLSHSEKFVDQELYEELMSRIHLLASKLQYMDKPQIITHKNAFPCVRRGWFRRPLYGPANNLGNVETWEYACAEIPADEYMQQPNDASLDKLFAALYRHRKPFWFVRRFFGADPSKHRVPFYDENIQKYEKRSRRVSRSVKLYTYFFFQSVRSQFPEVFPELYARRKDEGSVQKSDWGDVIVAFAGTTPGDEEKTGRALIQWTLKRMNHMAAEADRMIKEGKKNV